MKDLMLALALIAAVVFGEMSLLFNSRATDTELALARNEAEQATGPCGSDFIATVKNGDVLETYVAENRVSPAAVAYYFQEQQANGGTAIYRKGNRPDEKELVMFRPKR